MRFPLYARILCWFFLITGGTRRGSVLAFLSRPAGDWLIMQQAEPRLQSVSKLLVQELEPLPQDEWTGVLKKYSEAYGMDFTLFVAGGRQVAGNELVLPQQVRGRIGDRPFQPGAGPPQPGGGGFHQGFARLPRADRRQDDPEREPFPPRKPGFEQDNPPFQEQPGRPFSPPPGREAGGPGAPPEPRLANPEAAPNPNPGRPGRAPGRQPGRPDISFPKFLERSSNPDAWWFVIRMPLRLPAGSVSLVLRTESLGAGGLLIDFTPWLWGAVGLLVLSSLLWLPVVRGITRTVGKMKNATARIAEGQFDVHVPDQRRDELGELAAGINRMADRLSGFVNGQKRFLGDIAHELCTPLARMQMAGAALEQRAPEDMKERIADLTAEIDAMSQLTGELLDFSRAGLAPQSVELAGVPLLPLIEQAAAREGVAPEQLTTEVPAELSVRAHSGLLSRAMANVMRNSLRHAGAEAKLSVIARHSDGHILLTIADNGPGIPESALPGIFDPFFRLDASRDRASGGTGLGLAIVKSCIESCEGTVTARNRPSGGLEVRFVVPASAGNGEPQAG